MTSIGSGSGPTDKTVQAQFVEEISNTESVSDTNAILDRLQTSHLTSSEKNEVVSNLMDVVEQQVSVSTDNTKISANELISVFDRIENFVSILDEDKVEKFLQFSTNALADALVNETENDENIEELSSVAVKIENYAVASTRRLLDLSSNGGKSAVTLNLESVNVVGCNAGSEKCLLSSGGSEIGPVISDSTFRVTYIQHKKFSVTSSVGSQIVSATVEDINSNRISLPVNFVLKHVKDVGFFIPECGFIDAVNNVWSKDGCSVISTNVTHTRCSCNHMTNFAILFLHSDIKISAVEEFWFNIITYIGCGISITALLVTMTTFAALRLHKSERVVLLWHLCFCLCIAQLILVAGTNAVVGTASCKAIAILLHFFFMAAFSWMLMEGCQLYFKAVRAVKGGYNFKVVLVAGWTIPIIIVCASLGAGYHGYGNGRGCWISTENGMIWAFIGPAVGFIVINCILLTFVMKVFLGLKSVLKKNEVEKTKRAAKALACLMPLLGITWIFGLFAVGESTKWFLYLFCICNSLQGLGIFVLHCARNHEVRKAFLKKYRRSFMSIGPYSTSGSSQSGKSADTYLKSTTDSLPIVAKW
uniref:adhesion G protein-coupled receptor L3-like n=1 Tax=Styela clava TaxID=7725 RepID=UPI001939B04B|nr:adhesion G protein-coupled receptor L3-like [Styela clava]